MSFIRDHDIDSIYPVSWLGPDVFCVVSTGQRRVLVRRDHSGWYACSSPKEAYHGGSFVAGNKADLLDAAARALALSLDNLTLVELENEEQSVRLRAADSWKPLIERGASGEGPCGTDSVSDRILVELSGTLLPCGWPALELLERFSHQELDAIRTAMRILGHDGWYRPLLVGKRH